MHSVLAYSEGRTIFNIQVVYGIVGQKRNNPQLWKVVLWYTSRLGNAAQIICADCTFKMSVEGDMPREVFTALRRGLLVDITRPGGGACAATRSDVPGRDRSRDKDSWRPDKPPGARGQGRHETRTAGAFPSAGGHQPEVGMLAGHQNPETGGAPEARHAAGGVSRVG